MSQRKENARPDNRATKKEAVLGTNKKNQLPLIVALVCAVLVIGAGILFLVLKGKQVPSSVTATATTIAYPVELFNDGKARFFQHKASDGVTTKYFILRSSDGVIRAAFDACDVCWPQGKGYYQDGDSMVCRNCGRRFASIRVNEVTGGCNPGSLAQQVVGGKVLIQIKDILEGEKYFRFPKEG